MADINIKFDTGSIAGTDSNSNQYLIGILQKLNSTLEKLTNINNAKSSGNDRDDTIRSLGDLDKSKRRYQMDQQKMDNEFRQMGNKVGNLIGASIVTGIGASAIRFANNYSNALMGTATAQGNFAGSAISGNANQSASSYIGSLYDIERARRIEQNSIIAQGIGGTAGAAGGALLGGIAGGAAGLEKGPIAAIKGASTGATGGTALGGSLGYAAGTAYIAKTNAQIEREMLMQSAIAQRNMSASISQWRTSFSRWGYNMTNKEIVPSSISGGAPITVPLSSAFQSQYGKSQNYNAILNNIVPFLNSPIFSRVQTGNLDKVAQNFLKAGFSVEEFSKLTLQSSQYSAVTGKNIQQFSEDIKSARVKFGEGFDTNTLQNSLNLISLGYNKDQAQNIAYQAQFNSGMTSNVSRFANQGFSDYYRNQALSSVLGINLNETLRTGKFSGSDAQAAKYNSQIKEYFQTGKLGPDLGKVLATQAMSIPALQSALQNRVATNNTRVGSGLNSDLGPGQQLAQSVIAAITDGIKNVQQMNVTAQTVNISGQLSNLLPNSIKTAVQSVRNLMLPPSAQTGGGRSPTK